MFLGADPQATGKSSARSTHPSKVLSFVQLMPGYTCSFSCCGSGKEAYCREEGERLQNTSLAVMS